jgi:TolA-binding protein
MDTAVITAIISAVTTLIVSMGTWHLTAKQARKKEAEELKAIIEGYRDELRGKFELLKDEVTQVNASVQQQIAQVEWKIDTLSQRVEKHNNVIDRTYKLENQTNVQEEQIKNANRRIEDLENKLRSAG